MDAIEKHLRDIRHVGVAMFLLFAAHAVIEFRSAGRADIFPIAADDPIAKQFPTYRSVVNALQTRLREDRQDAAVQSLLAALMLLSVAGSAHAGLTSIRR